MTVFVPPQNGNPPKTVERPVTARTLPELIFNALQDRRRPTDPSALIRFIAELVAAPAIWDRTSRDYSRRICRRERRSRQSAS